jgi:hypothetical protein
MGVYHVLGDFEPIHPVILLVIAEDSQYCLHCLVCSFRLSVCLRVVRGAYVLFDVQLGTEFLEEL